MIPKPLLDDIVNGKCLPFIGAGFSLNAKIQNNRQMPNWNQLTKILSDDLQTLDTNPLEVSKKYEQRFGRPKLIETISEGLNVNLSSPGDVHKIFVKITSFDLVYTTNFDVLLEDAYKEQGIPFKSIVGPYQFAEFAGHKAVNIIKMHGDVNHSEYMIITQDDYDNFFRRYDAFSIHLSGLLMTRTPLFIGYSLKDPNFLQIKRLIENKMGKAIRKGYVVLFNLSDSEIKLYEKMNLTVINLESKTKSNAELMFNFLQEIYSYESLGEMKKELEFTLNKQIFPYGEQLEIEGRVKNPSEKIIRLKIVDRDGNIAYDEKLELENNQFTQQIILSGSNWKVDSNYYVVAEYGIYSANKEFYISQPFEIVIQTDKSVYIPGGDMILTVINPNSIVGIPINIEIFGPDGLVYKNAIPVDPDGDGIYQEIILIDGKNWSHARGVEYEIIAEYGGREARLTFFTSNFGATIELDQKVYSWTDKVYMTVVAPDHNKNRHEPDTIFVTVSTRKGTLQNYLLVETGNDTGIFTGEVTLSGFKNHQIIDYIETREIIGETYGQGPADGVLPSDDDDGLSVSFEFSEDETVIGSALIRWNIGEVQWLESSYRPDDKAIVRVIDPDMNLNPNKIDSFKIRIWSDADSVGIEVDVIETNEASGIFEGIVTFGSDSDSHNRKLKVVESDTVTAQYIDNTLPSPYSVKDSLKITGTTIISSQPLLPPLKRLSLKNLISRDERNTVSNKIILSELVTIDVEVINNQKFNQPFTLIMHIVDEKGVTIHTHSLSSSLTSKESSTYNLAWKPESIGKFDVQFFIWKSETEPEALAIPSNLSIQVVK